MPSRLAHHWTVQCDSGVAAALVRDFIRPAVRAVPADMAGRLGRCRFHLTAGPDAAVSSSWTAAETSLDISIESAGVEAHDVAMELLLCLGQVLWERLSDAELRAWWRLLRAEIDAGIEGEIDEQALDAKRALLRDRAQAGSTEILTRYASAAFAGTAAEYVHCLWHEVTVRSGREHLPPQPLRRRLELITQWFPPNPGYRLFPAEPYGNR